MIKLVNIFTIKNIKTKIKIIENISNPTLSFKNITQNASEYIDQMFKTNQKTNILKSYNKCGFYIKMYNTNAKAFYIDGVNNLIYYITLNINFKQNYILLRYYMFGINKDGKIS